LENQKNEELYQFYKTFTQGALEVLLGKQIEFVNSNPHSVYPGAIVTTDDGQQYLLQYLFESVYIFRKEIESLKSFQDLNQHLKQLPQDWALFYWGTEPLPFLASVVEKSEGFLFQEEVFNKRYQASKNLITSPTINLTVWLWLDRLKGECEGIKLDDSHTIRRITEQEIEKLRYHRQIEEIPTFSFFPRPGLRPGDYILDLNFEFNKAESKGYEEKLIKEVEKVVFLLRLYGYSRLRFKVIKDISAQAEYPQGYFTDLRYFESTSYNGDNSKKLFSEDESEELKDFWNRYYPLLKPSDSTLKIAINKFSRSFENIDMNSAFVDLMTGLEALYSTSISELKYQLSIKPALFLEEDIKKREYIKTFMGQAYNLRSDIVHGSETYEPNEKARQINKGEEKRTLQSIFIETRQYLGKSILKFLEWKSIHTDTIPPVPDVTFLREYAILSSASTHFPKSQRLAPFLLGQYSFRIPSALR